MNRYIILLLVTFLLSSSHSYAEIIKVFENDLNNINEKIIFLNGKILTDKNLINFVLKRPNIKG